MHNNLPAGAQAWARSLEARVEEAERKLRLLGGGTDYGLSRMANLTRTQGAAARPHVVTVTDTQDHIPRALPTPYNACDTLAEWPEASNYCSITAVSSCYLEGNNTAIQQAAQKYKTNMKFYLNHVLDPWPGEERWHRIWFTYVLAGSDPTFLATTVSTFSVNRTDDNRGGVRVAAITRGLSDFQNAMAGAANGQTFITLETTYTFL